MTFEEFASTLSREKAPKDLAPALHALWLDAKGDWDGAHELADTIKTKFGSRIHAYLHRKEGDPDNASYWYHRAGVSSATGSLEREWEALVREALE